MEHSASSTALVGTDQSLRVPCFCEENVWRLAYRKIRDESQEFYVTFVTNPEKCVPMFHQLASDDPMKPCYWDYHVILLGVSKKSGKTQVFDIDSHLIYPCDLKDYLLQVFPPNNALRPCFR